MSGCGRAVSERVPRPAAGVEDVGVSPPDAVREMIGSTREGFVDPTLPLREPIHLSCHRSTLPYAERISIVD